MPTPFCILAALTGHARLRSWLGVLNSSLSGVPALMATSDDVLVQFRAGLMNVENKTLKADQRKGLVRLLQVSSKTAPVSVPYCQTQSWYIVCCFRHHVVAQADDGLLHFRWFERVGAAEAKGDAQIDSIIFPGEATFSKVPTPANPTKASSQQLSRWLPAILERRCRWQVLVQAHAFTLWLLPQTKTEAFSFGMEHLQYSCCRSPWLCAGTLQSFMPMQDARAQN